LAFWASKTLLSAIELGVFSELSSRPEHFDSISGDNDILRLRAGGLGAEVAGGAHLETQKGCLICRAVFSKAPAVIVESRWM
jgi:hypothetical protein